MFLTFAFPGLASNVLSAAGIRITYGSHVSILENYTYTGNHTYAAVNGGESYAYLKKCFALVWQEVAELIAHPTITVSGQLFHVDVVFGADYKFNCTEVVLQSVQLYCIRTSKITCMSAVPPSSHGHEQCHITVLLPVVYCCSRWKVCSFEEYNLNSTCTWILHTDGICPSSKQHPCAPRKRSNPHLPPCQLYPIKQRV